jgi:predicted NBD/HSP70 family sugar kinase
MLTMGIDIGSRSSKCVILDDGQLLTYGSIETGPNIVKTAQAAVDAAVHRRTSLWGEYRLPLPDTKVGSGVGPRSQQLRGVGGDAPGVPGEAGEVERARDCR